MKTRKFKFTKNNQEYIISVGVTETNQIIVPYFKKLNGQILDISFYPDQQTFIEDLSTLIPKELDSDLSKFIEAGLFTTINKHIEKFGRITEADLDLYICENILVLEAIIKVNEGTEISYDQKCQFFENLKQRFK